MGTLMDREGYFRKSDVTWTVRGRQLRDKMHEYFFDFYEAGGSIPEAETAILGELWVAKQNVQIKILDRDGEYQKKLRRRRRKNSTRRTT